MAQSPRIDLAIAAGTRDFLEAWYGPPPNPIVDHPGDGPDALRRWWAWEEAWGRKLTHQNSVLAHGELFEDRGQTVFYVENQAVVVWGYEGTGDPPGAERVTDADSPWVPLGVLLSAFLSQVAVLEASFGPHVVSASGIERRRLDRLTDGLHKTAALDLAGRSHVRRQGPARQCILRQRARVRRQHLECDGHSSDRDSPGRRRRSPPIPLEL